MKKIVSVAIALLFVYHADAQSKEDKRIDFLYEQFRISYQTADSALLDKLYWPDAVYMWSNTAIENGRNSFMKNFGSFFGKLKELKDSIDIVFQLEKRVFSADKTMCTDVGYFVFTRKGSKEQSSTGKMVNVFTLRNGEWRFLVDMSGDAPKEVFKGTATITPAQ
jgi:ketosteroid isomerase-like protein